MIYCKLCSHEADVAAAISTAEIAAAWREQAIRVDIPGFEKVMLTRCTHCGFEAWQPAWVGDGDFYAQLSSFSWYYENSKWEYDAALQWIQKDAHVLEVGCGKGAFLKRLAVNGITAFGLDTNLNAVKTARADGLNVSGMDVREYAKTTNELFDVVCHFQVLEHIAEPIPFLETCAQLLKPGGQLLIATPNQDSFIRYAPFPLLNLPPHHQGRWTISAYQTASERLNLYLNRVGYEPLHSLHTGWALQSFVNKYLRVGIDRPYSRVARPLAKWVILRAAEYLGRILFSTAWVRARVRGHAILVSLRKSERSSEPA